MTLQIYRAKSKRFTYPSLDGAVGRLQIASYTLNHFILLSIDLLRAFNPKQKIERDTNSIIIFIEHIESIEGFDVTNDIAAYNEIIKAINIRTSQKALNETIDVIVRIPFQHQIVLDPINF